jgi:hypothetical protein
MNVSELDLVALSQALDDHDPDREHFLDTRTGSLWTFVLSTSTDETRKRLAEIRADVGAGGGWVRVLSMTTQQAYEEIEDFIEEDVDPADRETLFEALEKKGAIRNFREALMRMGDVRARWTVYRRERSRARLGRFLEGLGLSVPASDPPAEVVE